MNNKENKYIFNPTPGSEQLTVPQGKNSVNSLSALFEDREYYSNVIVPYVRSFFPDPIFGNLIKQNSLHGLVDQQLNVVTPTELFLTDIPGDKGTRKVMDFVAEAFTEMNNYLSKAITVGKLSKTSKYANLKAYRAYLPPQEFINEIRERVLAEFKDKVNNNMELAARVKDAKTFNKEFIAHIKESLKRQYPISKTAILLSSNFTAFVSGLILDLSNGKADDDSVKFEDYFMDSGFGIFADACKRFGFKIDENLPWRIMADLNSPAMKSVTESHTGYMLRNRIDGIESLFNKRYQKVILDELDHLSNFFFESYRDLVKTMPYYELDYKKLDKCAFNKQTVFKRPVYKKEDYLRNFSNEYWLRLFVLIRNYEEDKNLSQQQYENVVREANNYLSAGRQDEALLYVNDLFKEFKKVEYFSSLQNKSSEVQQIVPIKEELVF